MTSAEQELRKKHSTEQLRDETGRTLGVVYAL